VRVTPSPSLSPKGERRLKEDEEEFEGGDV
jgi:hypothetical protein